MLPDVKPLPNLELLESKFRTQNPRHSLSNLSQAHKNINQNSGDNTESSVVPFGWDEFKKNPSIPYIPYINTQAGQYVALRIVAHNIYKTIEKEFSNELLFCFVFLMERMTVNDAHTFNEINVQHSDQKIVGDYSFKVGDYMVKREDVKKLVDFYNSCRSLVLSKNKVNNLFGFLKIDGGPQVPFVWDNQSKLVPLFYFEGQSDYLDSRSMALTDPWKIGYLKFCCKVQKISKKYYEQNSIKVFNFEDVKRLFPEGATFEVHCPEKINEAILAPEVRVAALHKSEEVLPTSETMQIPIDKNDHSVPEKEITMKTPTSKQSSKKNVTTKKNKNKTKPNLLMKQYQKFKTHMQRLAKKNCQQNTASLYRVTRTPIPSQDITMPRHTKQVNCEQNTTSITRSRGATTTLEKSPETTAQPYIQRVNCQQNTTSTTRSRSVTITPPILQLTEKPTQPHNDQPQPYKASTTRSHTDTVTSDQPLEKTTQTHTKLANSQQNVADTLESLAATGTLVQPLKKITQTHTEQFIYQQSITIATGGVTITPVLSPKTKTQSNINNIANPLQAISRKVQTNIPNTNNSRTEQQAYHQNITIASVTPSRSMHTPLSSEPYQNNTNYPAVCGPYCIADSVNQMNRLVNEKNIQYTHITNVPHRSPLSAPSPEIRQPSPFMAGAAKVPQNVALPVHTGPTITPNTVIYGDFNQSTLNVFQMNQYYGNTNQEYPDMQQDTLQIRNKKRQNRQPKIQKSKKRKTSTNNMDIATNQILPSPIVSVVPESIKQQVENLVEDFVCKEHLRTRCDPYRVHYLTESMKQKEFWDIIKEQQHKEVMLDANRRRSYQNNNLALISTRSQPSSSSTSLIPNKSIRHAQNFYLNSTNTNIQLLQFEVPEHQPFMDLLSNSYMVRDCFIKRIVLQGISESPIVHSFLINLSEFIEKVLGLNPLNNHHQLALKFKLFKLNPVQIVQWNRAVNKKQLQFVGPLKDFFIHYDKAFQYNQNV